MSRFRFLPWAGVGDFSWIVGDTGKTHPLGDPEAPAEAWREFIDLGPHDSDRLGKAARTWIIKRFSLTAVARQYEKLYCEEYTDLREVH